MLSGMTTFTLIHVILSLIGIVSGVIVAYGLLRGHRLDGTTTLFLATTMLTSVTGFFFPFRGFKPSYGVGILSVLVLALAIYARYSRHLEGGWRRTYVITAMIGLYLNCFVLVAQLFMKVPELNVLAPTGSEAPFLIAQIVVMALFIVLTIFAAKNFRDAQ